MTVSVSLADDHARRTITLPEGATLVVRVEGDVTAVRVRLRDGATLFERQVNQEERAGAAVEIELDSLDLDRWSTVEVLLIEARELVAAHHRSATHEAPWRLLSTVAVRGARARAALWLSAALGVFMAWLWISVLSLAASRARLVADVAGALLCASAALPVLGLGRRRAPGVALTLLSLAMAGSLVSWRYTTTVFNPPGEMQDARAALPEGISRWMRDEARLEGEHRLRIKGAVLERGGRCEAHEARWPAFTLATERVALASGAWAEITVGAASILGITRDVECDAMGHCCYRVRSERVRAALPGDPLGATSVQAEVELRAGPPIDATLGHLLNSPMSLRLSPGHAFESVSLENAGQPNLTLSFRPSVSTDSFWVGILVRGWRGEARWPDRQRSSFVCASGASALTEFRAVLGTISSVEGDGWSADLSRSSRAIVCSRDADEGARDPVTLVVGPARRTGGSALSELWERNASQIPRTWGAVRLVRRDEGQRELALSESARLELRSIEAGWIAVELSRSLQNAQQIQLRWPGRTLLLWRRREASPPAVLLNVPTRVTSGASNSYAFFVSVNDGGATRMATATISRTPHGYVMEEAAPSAAPDCCRTAGELAYCDEVSPMTRLPPRRVPVVGAQIEGCGAVFENQRGEVIRDPIRR